MTNYAADWRTGYRSTRLDPELSTCETDVLWLILQGYTSKEIAKRLCLCASTVNRHVYRMCPKLGVRSRMQLALVVMNRLGEAARE